MITKGQISYCLRDAATLEIQEERTVDNIITEAYYDHLVNAMTLTNLKIVLQSKDVIASRWLKNITGTGIIADTAIPSVPSFQYVPATETLGCYIQLAGRYNAPSVQRVFKSISLTNPTNVVMASAKLTVPCTQATTQVLDVYYRLFLVADNTEDPQRFKELGFVYGNHAANSNRLRLNTLYPTPFVETLKAGDEQLSKVAQQPHLWSTYAAFVADRGVVAMSGAVGVKQKLTLDSTLTSLPGTIYRAMISGGDDIFWNYNYVTYTNSTSAVACVLSHVNLVGIPSKIQNLIGHGTTVKPISASPWLDIDNLPTGTGKIALSGVWNNRGVPNEPGLYAKTLLPQWNNIVVTDNGQVSNGSAKYKYVTRPFFGFKNVKLNTFSVSPNVYQINPLPSMCATGAVQNGDSNNWGRYTVDATKTIVENIATAYMGTSQLSASMAYDETSFVFVKKNMLILYSVGGGEYWKFKGAFTNICQIAVMGDKIYAACRDTGLYVIDPKNSLAVVSLADATPALNLSACYGVAKGFNDTLWAVGVNGLGKLESGVWTAYNETSTPAFSMAGVSNALYNNVEYLKVDALSTTFQMHLVRRVDATVDAAVFGVWWSTTTPAANSFTDVLTPSMGRPRINRTHFGGHGGLWAVANQTHKLMAFGSTAPTAVSGAGSIADNKLSDPYTSIVFVKNKQDQVCLLTMHHLTSISGDTVSQVFKLVNSAGVTTDSVTSGLTCVHGGWLLVGIFGQSTTRARTSVENNYGYNDCAASFVMDNGAMITLWCGTENKNANYSTSYVSQAAVMGTVDNLMVGVANYATDLSLSGGALAYLSEREYGWDGTDWVEGLTTGKPMHLTAQPLLDGVSVRFEDGAAGVSFMTPNYYKFGCCEGILKDNATRHRVQLSHYTRRLKENQTELGTYTVPAVAALSTGPITALNPDKSTEAATINASDQIVFTSEAGMGYATATQQVTGDFEITYDFTGWVMPASTGMIYFGVAKQALMDKLYGFGVIDNTIYVTIANGTFSSTGILVSQVTSINLKRTAGVLQTNVNGLARGGWTAAGTNIQAHDERLDVVACQGDTADSTRAIANCLAPKMTITVNGSDTMTYVGDPVAKTGAYGPRFCGIDTELPFTVTLDGVTAPVSFTGDAPSVGQVCVDPYAGALYFNAADVGKAIAAKFTYLQTE